MGQFQPSKIAVAGAGYVGLSVGVLLSQHHSVYLVDVVPEKISLINQQKSPIRDDEIERFLSEKELDLTATLSAEAAYSGADLVVVAVPTNYDSETNYFDTSAVETVVLQALAYSADAIIVIKSTVPVGYTRSLREKTGSKNILFSPEFLRESRALYDNLYPSRIIVGADLEDERLVEAAQGFAALLREGAEKEHIDTDHGLHRGGSGKAVCQYLPGPAGILLQRAGHLRGDERIRHQGHH